MLLCPFSVQSLGKAIRAIQQVSESSPSREVPALLGLTWMLQGLDSSREGCSPNPSCFQSAACSVAGLIGAQEKQSSMISPPGRGYNYKIRNKSLLKEGAGVRSQDRVTKSVSQSQVKIYSLLLHLPKHNPA